MEIKNVIISKIFPEYLHFVIERSCQELVIHQLMYFLSDDVQIMMEAAE
jgi:hypothetical protein